ncbi:MAG: Asp-tRNA(Asn)/Glu-tRNA(Gln) amidotransferase subunit GatC [Candidatus Bathyarchaeia archaeon]
MKPLREVNLSYVEGYTMKKRHLSKKEVEHIAWLAHIELSEKEKDLFTTQFNDILDYFKKIDKVDTEGIQPTYHVLDIENIYREDEASPSLPPEETLKNAPKKEKQFLKAPRIV